MRDIIIRLRNHGIRAGIKCTELGIKVHEGKVGFGNPEDPPPWGYERVCDALGYRGCMGKWNRDHMAFRTILFALSVSRHRPPVLELGNIWNGVPVRDLDELWLAKCLNAHAFRDLHTLRLALTIGRTLYFRSEQQPEIEEVNAFLKSFHRALTAVPQLEILGLTILPERLDDLCLGEQVFSTLLLLGGDNLCKLKGLELERHRINVWELVHFLNQRRDTIKSVSFRYIKNRQSGSELVKALPDIEECAEISELLLLMLKGLLNIEVEWHGVYDGEEWRSRSSKVVSV